MNGVIYAFRKLLRDRRGSIAVKFALAVPVIALLSAGSIDLMAVSACKSRMQSIADNAALAGARSLTLAADDILAEQRSKSFVEGEMSQWSGAPTYTATYVVTDARDGRYLKVTLNGHRPSFFGSLLPPGGWDFSADASASPVGQTPLCAIGTGRANGLNAISTQGASRLRAPDCMVHSNSNIRTRSTSTITAAAVHTVLGVTGTGIRPTAGQGALPIEDPFASMVFPSLSECDGRKTKPVIYEGRKTFYLEAGVHCSAIRVIDDATLILEPGIHSFNKLLLVQNGAELIGDNVLLYFGDKSNPRFREAEQANDDDEDNDEHDPNGDDDINIDLVGRKSGPYAGMVMATTGGGQPNISIPGGNVKRLLGVVYVRRGFLEVTGDGVAAEESDWTVVVANNIRLEGDAALKINADYDNSDVPVPNGVGPNGGIMTGTRLTN